MKRILSLTVLIFSVVGLFAQPSNYYLVRGWTSGSGTSMSTNSPTSGIIRNEVVATASSTDYLVDWDNGYNRWTNNSTPFNSQFSLNWTANNYTIRGVLANSTTIDKHYTFQIAGLGYSSRQAVIMETDNAPRSFHATNSTAVSTPLPGSVNPGQTVTINIELAGPKSPQERVFVRYSTNSSFTSSDVVEATGTGFTWSTASAIIPANVAGTTVYYYAYTTTVSATASSHHDLITLRLGNNGGSNYQFTVNSGFISLNPGNWSNVNTWGGTALPSTGASITIDTNVTLDQDATVSSLTITAGTFTASDATARTLTISRSASGSANTLSNAGGTWANGAGGSTVVFTGAPSGGSDAIHSTSGFLGFQNVTINKTGGSNNVGVSFTTNSSVSGTLQIGNGGFVSTPPPNSFYVASAILEFNQGVSAVYNVNADPEDKTWSTIEIPQNITITSGTVNLKVNREATGDLIVSNSAALNLAADVELEINGTLDLDGTITLNSSDSSYSQLKVDGSISGSGTLTLQQYLESGWHNISALGNGSAGILGNIGSNATNGTANTQNLYSWNAANSSWVNVANNSASISAGGGYMGFVGTYGIQNSAGLASWTYPVNSLVSSHQPSLGYSVANGAVNYQGIQNNGWNLVGNPFPCVLRLPESGWGNNVETSVHIMNSEGNYEGSSRLGGNMHIAPGQSFWIRTINSTNIGFPNLSMSSHCNVGESPEYQKTQSLVADRFYLQVYEPGNTSKGDRFLLGMVAGTQDGLDLSWDATKRLNSPGYPSFFSVSGNYPLAINAIDYGPNNIRPRKLPMRFISTKAYEAYRIELHDSLLTNAYKILLHDHLLNKTHDLNWGPYDFENVPNNEYRFELHIENITTVNNGLLPMGAQGNGISFGNNGGSLVLKATDLAQGAEVNVYNLSGKRIESLRFEAGSSLQTVNMNHWPKGVYLLEILSAEGREMHKLINE